MGFTLLLSKTIKNDEFLVQNSARQKKAIAEMQAAILVYWPFYQLHKQICAAVDFSVEIKGAPTSKTHTSLHHLWLMLLVVCKFG